MDEDETCGLCDRPMPASTRSNHHLIPKSRKGKETVPIHRFCHSNIHALFTDKQLERQFNTLEALRAHPEIEKFISWVRNKPPEFYTKTKQSSR